MEELTDRDLSGARFENVSLRDATFDWVDLRGARFKGALFVDVTIEADLQNLVINGVDVGPLIEAELDRRHPGRDKVRPTDPAGFREGLAVVGALWAETVERARRLDPELLHESVDGEWSFIQTLRHLVFATDVWIRRVIGGDPHPWHPLGLPFTEMTPTPSIPVDHDARPDLDTVLALRADRRASLQAVIEALTDDDMTAMTEPVEGPGFPEPRAYPKAEAIRIVLSEEFEHRLFAERDLTILETRG